MALLSRFQFILHLEKRSLLVYMTTLTMAGLEQCTSPIICGGVILFQEKLPYFSFSNRSFIKVHLMITTWTLLEGLKSRIHGLGNLGSSLNSIGMIYVDVERIRAEVEPRSNKYWTMLWHDKHKWRRLYAL